MTDEFFNCKNTSENTANKTLGFVKRNVVTKNKDIKTLAYNSLVRPQVEFASAVWSPYTKKTITKLKKSKEGQPDGSQMTTPHIVV